MRDILSSMPAILQRLEGGDAAAEAMVFVAWKNVVGETLEQHAVPVRLIKRKLFVAVSSETWRKQVADLAPQMVFKLNGALGASVVSFVEFRVDSKAVWAHRHKTEDRTASDAEWSRLAANEITTAMEDAAGAIADEKLRNVFLAAAGSSLARTRKPRA